MLSGSTSGDDGPPWVWIIGGMALLAGLLGGMYVITSGAGETKKKEEKKEDPKDKCVRINPARLRWPPEDEKTDDKNKKKQPVKKQDSKTGKK